MFDDDVEFIEAPDGQVFMLQDRISARTEAYIRLLDAARSIKEPELVDEALEMLKRIRLSIGVYSDATINVVKGGKGN